MPLNLRNATQPASALQVRVDRSEDNQRLSDRGAVSNESLLEVLIEFDLRAAQTKMHSRIKEVVSASAYLVLRLSAEYNYENRSRASSSKLKRVSVRQQVDPLGTTPGPGELRALELAAEMFGWMDEAMEGCKIKPLALLDSLVS